MSNATRQQMSSRFEKLVTTVAPKQASALVNAAKKDNRIGWMPFNQRMQMAQHRAQQAAKQVPRIPLNPTGPTKLIIEQKQSPGDILMLTSAVRRLRLQPVAVKPLGHDPVVELFRPQQSGVGLPHDPALVGLQVLWDAGRVKRLGLANSLREHPIEFGERRHEG